MAVHQSSPSLHSFFSQLLDNVVGHEIRRVDSILAESHLRTCEYEDDYFRCGAIATVTEVESERDYCLRHFGEINLNGDLMSLKSNHGVLSTAQRERS
jgi:hypothetical protein